jgi:hypothetical protein
MSQLLWTCIGAFTVEDEHGTPGVPMAILMLISLCALLGLALVGAWCLLI